MTDPNLQLTDELIGRYLDGEQPPELRLLIANNPGLQGELDEARRIQEVLRKQLGGSLLADSLDLLAVAMDVASAKTQLRVAAYLRVSPVGQAQMAALLAKQAPKDRRRTPVFLALPTFNVANRSSDETSLYVAAINAQVILNPPQLTRRTYSLSGVVLKDNQPQEAKVLVRGALLVRARSTSSNSNGYFQFTDLTPGRYDLEIRFPQATIFVRNQLLGSPSGA